MLKTFIFFISINSAFGQSAPAAAPAANPMMQFLPIVIIFVIFYFLMIRPQKKKFEEEQALINKLAKGDEIFTKTGMFGKIYGVNDKIVDLEIADGVRIKMLKNQIGGLSKTVLESDKK